MSLPGPNSLSSTSVSTATVLVAIQFKDLLTIDFLDAGWSSEHPIPMPLARTVESKLIGKRCGLTCTKVVWPCSPHFLSRFSMSTSLFESVLDFTVHYPDLDVEMEPELIGNGYGPHISPTLIPLALLPNPFCHTWSRYLAPNSFSLIKVDILDYILTLMHASSNMSLLWSSGYAWIADADAYAKGGQSCNTRAIPPTHVDGMLPHMVSAPNSRC